MLKLADIFGNHMVLQRDKKIAIFGSAAPKTDVYVSFRGVEEHTSSDMSGKWICYLSPQSVGSGDDLIVTDNDQRICIEDVAVGDIFFAGGQSNMEYYMKFDAEYSQEEAQIDTLNTNIRFYDVPKVSWDGELNDYDYSAYGKWRILSRENLPFYSAVSYYFLKQLYAELKIPLAVVCCSFGGSNSSAWLPKEDIYEAGGGIWWECYEEGLKSIKNLDFEIAAYKKYPRSNPAKKLFDPDNARMMFPGFSKEEQQELVKNNKVQRRALLPCDPWRPAGLYHYMVQPLIPFTFKGILWYQGESDSAHPEVYEGMFRQNIHRLRRDFGTELSVLFVQLAPFGQWLNSTGTQYPILRAAQERVANQMPNTWMATSGDVGMEWDIHPKHKRKIGERLCLLALGHIYEKQLLCDAPIKEQCNRYRNELHVRFKYADGLHIEGEHLNGLKVFVHHESIEPENIAICGDELILFFVDLPQENIDLEFAQTPFFDVNLYNGTNIPAVPFKDVISKGT